MPRKYISGTDQSSVGRGEVLTNAAQKVKLSETESETPPRHHEKFGQLLQAREVEGVQTSQMKIDRYTGTP